MQTPISECIRQLRRQRGMTQAELGGEHFSKSYVSAVEREKIVPSSTALRFFAEQLDQPVDYFKQLVQHSVLMEPDTDQLVSSSPFQDENDEQDDSMALVGMVIEGIEPPYASFPHGIAPLSLEEIRLLPLQKQARYCLAKGLILQDEGNLEGALHLLERALVLSPTKHQPAILDALGTNSALAHTYQAALSYHRRALRLLEVDGTEGKAPALLLKVKLHCGDDYRAQGILNAALEHYENARQSLNTSSNMDIAGQTYMGLGYCTYASIYQEPGSSKLSYAEKEGQLQRAIGFLLQSRTLYQISSNKMGETKARLLHAIILLGLSSLRQQMMQERSSETRPLQSLQCITLLEEAEEQCRQILLSWNESILATNIAPLDLEVIVYTALSSLVSVYVQRAEIARQDEYSDTALRDRARAAYLCQLILDTLLTSEPLHALIQDALKLENFEMYRIQTLPRLPDLTKHGLSHNPMGLAAIFFASGEVAEELGRAATTAAYASDCYIHADKCFKASLHMEHQSAFSKEHDVSYLTRSYQRCVRLIEERLEFAPLVAERTYQTVLEFFKESLVSFTNI